MRRSLSFHVFYVSLMAAAFAVGGWLWQPDLVAAKTNRAPIKAGDPLPANLFIELAKEINPTVVNISTSTLPNQQRGVPGYPDPFGDLFQHFMGPNPFYYQQQRPMQALGTGFIIREDGLIITNNHVVDKADVIQVQLNENSKEMYQAKVVGKDARTDIALIKIEVKKKLPVATLGSSSSLQVGEWVAAFGNPYGHGHTMTKGIISAVGREIDELNRFPFLQTDASINPGNSGGPLVNTQGEVIGVNSAIDARAQGIGFAIPIDNVKSILPTLEKNGSIKRGFLGVLMQDVDEESAKSLGITRTDGALITQVIPDSPAEKSGMKAYDLVVQAGDKKVTNTRELAREIQNLAPGDKIKMVVIRNKADKELTMTIGRHPDDEGEGPNLSGRQYDGQKAPFDLGFKITDYNRELANEFGLPPLREKHPVIIDVDRGSIASWAGLAPGDIILDVNRAPVTTSRDVLKALRKDGVNVMRVLKQNRVALLYLKPR